MKLRLFFIKQRTSFLLRPLAWLLLFTFLAACNAAFPAPTVKVIIQVDGGQNNISINTGKTVQNSLDQAGITLNSLDRVDPPVSSLITADTTIQIKRVREEFSTEDKIIPFQQQTLKNESLPDKQQLIIQKGANGKQQITYRKVFEDNIEVSKTVVKTVTLAEALPEIIMLGVQTPFTPIEIPGKLLYLTGGNA